ncbi:MAG: MerR family transcriptional regulator, partial [Pseudomonadota bacterium]
MSKSSEAFRTISEVADWLGTQPHVLRFWESKFSQVKPVKRAGGRRYYRPADVQLLAGIKHLLHDDGITIKGVQKILNKQGIKHVASYGPPLEAEQMNERPEATDGAVVESSNGAPRETVPHLTLVHDETSPESVASDVDETHPETESAIESIEAEKSSPQLPMTEGQDDFFGDQDRVEIVWEAPQDTYDENEPDVPLEQIIGGEAEDDTGDINQAAA